MTPPPPERDPADRDPADPDLAEHLWNAAHEMLQAMRKLVDAADELVEQQRNRPRGTAGATEPRLRRIDIDAQ